MSVPGNQQNCCFYNNPPTEGATNIYHHYPINNGNACYNSSTPFQEPKQINDSNDMVYIPYSVAFKQTINNGDNYIICVGDTDTGSSPTPSSTDFPDGDKTCHGRFILVTENTKYYAPSDPTSGTCGEPCNDGEKYNVKMFYYNESKEKVYYTGGNSGTNQVYIEYYKE